MAIFCEALAETAVVAEACEIARMGISGAYAARRRNPVFAAAWDAALTIARERLADTLLARSMEGNIEQIYKDGELVGERHVLDNRLGLQILRRLDRLAERNPWSCGGRSPVQRKENLDPCLRRGTGSFDWNLAVDALRIGDDEGVARALALIEGDKVDEVEALGGGHAGGMVVHGAAPNLPLRNEEDDTLDLSDRCWLDEDSECWMTDFPPPADFTGYESRAYEDDEEDRSYVRACSEEEVAILEADRARFRAVDRAEQEDLRDAWFALLKSDVDQAESGE